jgi:MoxR-like ATPase
MNDFNNMLETNGVYGYSSISKPILAALVSKEPLLLVGEHGTGKTMLAETLSAMLGFSNYENNKEFIAYDASKSLFEDVVGFPDPVKLQQGTLDYIESSLTIWNKKFILIDEISRANPSMQNKWLEIIRSRRLMGKSIPNLQYIFSAMNPISYLGANLLDSALADRFFLIVNVPSKFERNDLSKIINNSNTSEKTSKELLDIITKVTDITKKLDQSTRNVIDNFILDFNHKVEELGLLFSPRRCAMMKRSLSIFLAIDLLSGPLTKEQISYNFALCVRHSWNYFVASEDAHLDVLEESFLNATIKVLKTKSQQVLKEFKDYKEKNKSTPHTKGKQNPANTNNHNQISDYDDGDLKTFLKIFGAGIELFTVGFYQMVIKKNSAWKSELEIMN